MDKNNVFNISMESLSNYTPDVIAKVEKQQRDTLNILRESAYERELIEEDKSESLRTIANNLEETVSSLREMNGILKENNRLLSEKNKELDEKIQCITTILESIADISKEFSENQEEMMRQALALSLQLNISTEENRKLNWKEVFANTSINAAMVGLQMFLHSNGLI